MSDRMHLRSHINQLVQRTGIPTICLQHGVGVIDSSTPNYYGVYTGSLASKQLKAYVDQSDFTISLYPLYSDTGTAGWSAMPNVANTMTVTTRGIDFKQQLHEVSGKDFILSLFERPELDQVKAKQTLPLPKQFPFASEAVIPSASSPISQDYLWPRLSSFFRSGDTILLANGTPLIGSRLFDLPSNVRVIASGLWYSVGHMLPAALGAALALKDRPRSPTWSGRTILLEGDGSFQATAQELGTIVRYKLDCIVIIANNEGYAYERLIEGPDADFNDVARWAYTSVPAMMGAKSTAEYPVRVFSATNVGEMEGVLHNSDVQKGEGMTLIDVRMGRQDVPQYFREALVNAGKRLRGL
jgi:pyruvate decarboxylase